jgi:hypothetical protein
MLRRTKNASQLASEEIKFISTCVDQTHPIPARTQNVCVDQTPSIPAQSQT